MPRGLVGQEQSARPHVEGRTPIRRNGGRGAAQVFLNIGGISMGRGILLWLLGVPIPVIILIFLFFR
jgi:hypothetical protein